MPTHTMWKISLESGALDHSAILTCEQCMFEESLFQCISAGGQNNVLSGVGFEPTPSSEDQNAHPYHVEDFS